MRFSKRFVISVLVALPITMSVGLSHATTLYLKGNVVYRERMALPANAEVEVTLADVSIADAPSTVIASNKFQTQVSSPIPYELKFDSAAIDSKHHYALQARISVGDQLLFTTTTNQSVFAGEENDTQIFVQRISQAPETATLQQLVGNWSIKEIDGDKPVGRSESTLQFSADGRASFYVGCNRMGGEAKIDNNKLSFGLLMSTQMACDEVLMKQEEKLSKIITHVQSYEMSKDGLVLFDAQSKPVLRLERSK